MFSFLFARHPGGVDARFWAGSGASGGNKGRLRMRSRVVLRPSRFRPDAEPIIVQVLIEKAFAPPAFLERQIGAVFPVGQGPVHSRMAMS